MDVSHEKKKVNVTFKIWAYSARDHLSESLSNVHIRSLEVYVKKHTPKSYVTYVAVTKTTANHSILTVRITWTITDEL